MKVANINPFIEAVESTFKSLCDIDVERVGELSVNVHEFKSSNEVFSVITLSGAANGSVVMVMGNSVARHVVRAFLGETTVTDEDLMDGFGEILNMIVGGATSKLPDVRVSAPRISLGRLSSVYSSTDSPWVVIPMKFPEWGPFSVEVSFKD